MMDEVLSLSSPFTDLQMAEVLSLDQPSSWAWKRPWDWDKIKHCQCCHQTLGDDGLCGYGRAVAEPPMNSPWDRCHSSFNTGLQAWRKQVLCHITGMEVTTYQGHLLNKVQQEIFLGWVCGGVQWTWLCGHLISHRTVWLEALEFPPVQSKCPARTQETPVSTDQAIYPNSDLRLRVFSLKEEGVHYTCGKRGNEYWRHKGPTGMFLGLLTRFLSSSFCTRDRTIPPWPLKLGVAIRLALDTEMSVEVTSIISGEVRIR